MGSSITVRHITAGGGQEFLTGHTHPIGCLALSNSGKYLATGETHLIGSKVSVSLLYVGISDIFLKSGLFESFVSNNIHFVGTSYHLGYEFFKSNWGTFAT